MEKLLIGLNSEDSSKAGLLLLWPPGADFKLAGGLSPGKGGLQWCRVTVLQCLTWLTNRVCQL